VHSAEDWDELLLPEIERQQAEGKQVAFRADAAFAKPEIYEALEKCGVMYAFHCGYKIWSRRRKVGTVSEKSITRQQAGRFRRAKNEPSARRSLAGGCCGHKILGRGTKES
jgi:hypothetical protein